MKALKVLGFIWQLPETVLVWLFYVFPMWAMGAVKYAGMPSFLVFRFDVTQKVEWYWKLWKGWLGWTGACVVFIKDAKHEFGDMPTAATAERIAKANEMTLKHELRHADQGFIFGALQYPLYLLASVFIWVFMRNKHAYLDNPFERDARRFAGDLVDVPPEKWPDGLHDRWPWW